MNGCREESVGYSDCAGIRIFGGLSGLNTMFRWLERTSERPSERPTDRQGTFTRRHLYEDLQAQLTVQVAWFDFTVPPIYDRYVLPGVYADLVTALGFKPSVAAEKSPGGFDSHPLPLEASTAGFSRSFGAFLLRLD